MKHDLKALRDLEKRLAEATGPDRETDCQIHVTVFGWKLARVGSDVVGENDSEIWTETGKLVEGFGYPPKGCIAPFFHVPDVRYTTSLDAAVALVGRVLPSREWKVGVDLENGKAWAAVGDDHWDECHYDITAEASIPALALCLACVRALIAQGEVSP